LINWWQRRKTLFVITPTLHFCFLYFSYQWLIASRTVCYSNVQCIVLSRDRQNSAVIASSRSPSDSILAVMIRRLSDSGPHDHQTYGQSKHFVSHSLCRLLQSPSNRWYLFYFSIEAARLSGPWAIEKVAYQRELRKGLFVVALPSYEECTTMGHVNLRQTGDSEFIHGDQKWLPRYPVYRQLSEPHAPSAPPAQLNTDWQRITFSTVTRVVVVHATVATHGVV